MIKLLKNVKPKERIIIDAALINKAREFCNLFTDSGGDIDEMVDVKMSNGMLFLTSYNYDFIIRLSTGQLFSKMKYFHTYQDTEENFNKFLRGI